MSCPRTSVPGPGVYEVNTKKAGPSYSFRPKFEVRLRQNFPGPGKYYPKNSVVSNKMPAWVIGKSEKGIVVDKDAKILPGPGSYSKTSTLGGPMWRFGSSDRNVSSPPSVPGPGAYQIKPALGNSPPYVSIKTKNN